MTRRSLTPTAARIPGVLPQRRASGGARREATDRVTLKLGQGLGGDRVSLEGWALNVSRGGVRAIVDGSSVEGAAAGEETPLPKLLELGRALEITLGEAKARPGKIVWVQEEPDGAVMGIAFSDTPSDSGAPPPLTPDAGSRGSDPFGPP